MLYNTAATVNAYAQLSSKMGSQNPDRISGDSLTYSFTQKLRLKNKECKEGSEDFPRGNKTAFLCIKILMYLWGGR